MKNKQPRRRVYSVDFQKLENRSYESLNEFGRELVDKMIELNKPKDLSMTQAQEALYDMLDAAMKELTETQKTVLEYSFGINGKEKLTNAQVARELGISRQAVFSLKRRALKRLKSSTVLNEKVVKNLKKPPKSG